MKELNQVRKFLMEALKKAKSIQCQYDEEWSAGQD